MLGKMPILHPDTRDPCFERRQFGSSDTRFVGPVGISEQRNVGDRVVLDAIERLIFKLSVEDRERVLRRRSFAVDHVSRACRELAGK